VGYSGKMRFTWRGSWRNGEILVEAETLEELNAQLDKLLGNTDRTSQPIIAKFPLLPSGLGCSDALKALLKSEWGNQPKSMAEIKNALEANSLYFSKGTLSGTLKFLDKKGELSRFKDSGKWVYTSKKK
jgi:hypothetical protein